VKKSTDSIAQLAQVDLVH